MNSEAFVYCWTDHKTNMLYVGYHKHKNISKPFQDGYIANGLYERDIGKKKKVNWFFEEYSKRPRDFTRQVIAEGTVEECAKLETSILKSADAMHSNEFYNRTNGDEKFVLKHHTQESRSKISNSRKGMRMSEETKKKLHVLYVGKPLSEEHKMKISIGNRGKKLSEESKKAVSLARKGKPLSLEHKQKLSLAHRGKLLSEEHRKNISKSNMGRVVTGETKEKISNALKGNNNFGGHTHSLESRIKMRTSIKNRKEQICVY